MADSKGHLPSTVVGNRHVGFTTNLPKIMADPNDESWSCRARFAWDEFFSAEIANRHTRAAYLHAVKVFLAWCEERHLELRRISPGAVGEYIGQHPGSVPT